MAKRKTLTFNLGVAIITVLIQVTLAFTPFIPLTATFWNAESQQAFYNNLTALIALQLALLTGAVTLILLKGLQDQRDSFAEMRSALPLTVVTKLKDLDFYIHFRNAVETAKHSVCICYFAPYPPGDIASKDRKKYYDAILDIMKKRDDVPFKRLIRDAPENDEWIAELLRSLQNRPNVSISLLTRDLPAEDLMPLALSVQIVDNIKTWFVAVAEHETERDFRDIYIENADVATAMTFYFERLWGISEPLLDHGRVTEHGETFLRRVH